MTLTQTALILSQQVEDLSEPYERYASVFLTNFNSHPAITSNRKLDGILAAVSIALRPTPPLTQWTIDALFLLPYSRLRYYHRLYDKLLMSASEGRSDHRMLQHATVKLNRIISSVEERLDMDANQVEKYGEDEVIRRSRRSEAAAELRAAHESSSSNVVRKSSGAGSKDKGRNKLEEERRSVAKWEQRKRNNGGGSHDSHRS
jgi:hypothetical protein